MRGKPADSGVEVAEAASTPAYAGQTQDRRLVPVVGHLYPRICGANLVWVDGCPVVDPLPPHMRGKRRADLRLASGRASTPAYAGQTGSAGWGEASDSLYPRICGANLEDASDVIKAEPLPPHMRGKHL